jgi:hypothetical protein
MMVMIRWGSEGDRWVRSGRSSMYLVLMRDSILQEHVAPLLSGHVHHINDYFRHSLTRAHTIEAGK